MKHTARQLDTLRKIGVEVWTWRGAEAGEAVEAAESAEFAESAETVAPAAAGEVAAAESAAAKSADPPAASPPAADSPADPELQVIEREVSACRRCELHQTRTHTVFGCGNARADWLFVGEAPGRHEDLQGEPFVGRAGKLLDMMIAALGMRREQVFIANVLKCRPPNNRDPLPGEIEQCEPYLHRQLALIQPKVIVALGRISAQALLRTGDALSKLRGTTYRYGPGRIPLVVTYHPAYLLRSPEQKAKAWDDLWLAREIVRAAAEAG